MLCVLSLHRLLNRHLFSFGLECLSSEIARTPHGEPILRWPPAATVHVHVAILIAEYVGLSQVNAVTNVQSQTYGDMKREGVLEDVGVYGLDYCVVVVSKYEGG